MKAILPDVESFLMPKGTQAIVYAKDQPEYDPLPSLKTLDGVVVTQWQPDAEELKKLNAGMPITLVLHTFHQPLHPVLLAVGGLDLRPAETLAGACCDWPGCLGPAVQRCPALAGAFACAKHAEVLMVPESERTDAERQDIERVAALRKD